VTTSFPSKLLIVFKVVKIIEKSAAAKQGIFFEPIRSVMHENP
jgi:hypothetical protein